MSKFARILEIDNEQVLVGLLNDKGLCGSGTCEGCSCSTKMQTMKVKVRGASEKDSILKTGIDVEMIIPDGTLTDWFLLIFLPVILTAAIVFLLYNENEVFRNLTALGTGIGSFIISALLLKYLRKDQTIELIPVHKEPPL